MRNIVARIRKLYHRHTKAVTIFLGVPLLVCWVLGSLFIFYISALLGPKNIGLSMLYITIFGIISSPLLGLMHLRFRNKPLDGNRRKDKILLASIILYSLIIVIWSLGVSLPGSFQLWPMIGFVYMIALIAGVLLLDLIRFRRYILVVTLAVPMFILALPKPHLGFAISRNCMNEKVEEAILVSSQSSRHIYDSITSNSQYTKGSCGLIDWSSIRITEVGGHVLFAGSGGFGAAEQGYIWTGSGEPQSCRITQYLDSCDYVQNLGDGWYYFTKDSTCCN